MYSLRYGTVPIVRNTGGLADTVIDATDSNIERGIATGFVFNRTEADGLRHALFRALNLYRNKPVWRRLCRQAMEQDFGWEKSAMLYKSLYQAALSLRRSR